MKLGLGNTDVVTHLIACLCLSFATLLASSSSAAANPIISDDVAAIEYGYICDVDARATAVAEDTITGTIDLVEGTPEFISHSLVGPARIGVGFGVALQVKPEAEGYVTIHVQHPPQGAEGITDESWQTYVSANRLHYSGFGFDHPYELTPGTWTISARRGDTVLYEIAFEILSDATLPYALQACGLSVPIS